MIKNNRVISIVNARVLSLLLSIGLFSALGSANGSSLYFLCGPDEDGCFEDDYSACACVPQDESANKPHCLDFSVFQCKPLSEIPNCRSDLIYKNQGDCIATIFHSTPRTPCRVKTRAFCIQHQIQFCDHNAEPNNCHASSESSTQTGA